MKTAAKFALLAAMALSALAPTSAAVAESTSVASSDISATVAEGRIQITSNKTNYIDEKNAYVASGSVQVTIGGQNSMLEADSVVYHETSMTIDARGNVRITRNGQVTTGSAFRFLITSEEYLITKPGTIVTNPMGTPVFDLFFRNPPEKRDFDESLIEPEWKWLRSAGYGNGSERGGGVGDFGSSKLYFIPGLGLSKHHDIDKTR